MSIIQLIRVLIIPKDVPSNTTVTKLKDPRSRESEGMLTAGIEMMWGGTSLVHSCKSCDMWLFAWNTIMCIEWDWMLWLNIFKLNNNKQQNQPFDDTRCSIKSRYLNNSAWIPASKNTQANHDTSLTCNWIEMFIKHSNNHHNIWPPTFKQRWHHDTFWQKKCPPTFAQTGHRHMITRHFIDLGNLWKTIACNNLKKKTSLNIAKTMKISGTQTCINTNEITKHSIKYTHNIPSVLILKRFVEKSKYMCTNMVLPTCCMQRVHVRPYPCNTKSPWKSISINHSITPTKTFSKCLVDQSPSVWWSVMVAVATPAVLEREQKTSAHLGRLPEPGRWSSIKRW